MSNPESQRDFDVTVTRNIMASAVIRVPASDKEAAANEALARAIAGEGEYDIHEGNPNDFSLGASINEAVMEVDPTHDKDGQLQHLLRLLIRAQAVSIGDSPLLSTWYIYPATGEADNQVILFRWMGEDAHVYSVKLTESGIQNGIWKGSQFLCEDHEGDLTTLRLFHLSPLN